MRIRAAEMYLPKPGALKTPVLLCLAPLLLLAGCNSGIKEENGPVVKMSPVRGVRIETVHAELKAETIEVPGTVRARNVAVVAARIAGTIRQLRVHEGDRVQRGDVLAVLDARENEANAAVAQASIDEAQQGLEEAVTRKKLADVTFGRYQKLFNEQAITKQEFDTKTNEKELAEKGISRAEARLKQAQESSKAAGSVAGYARISAPISGVITSRQANLGASVFPGQPLLTIEEERYQLELLVPESLIARIKPGSGIQVALDALQNTFKAKVDEIIPSVDSGNHTFIAKITLVQKGLKSGMFGRGAIDLATMTTGISVPKTALQKRGALTMVWIVDKDSQARMRLIKTGKVIGDRVEILSGISEAERVIVAGTEGVSEGARVE